MAPQQKNSCHCKFTCRHQFKPIPSPSRPMFKPQDFVHGIWRDQLLDGTFIRSMGVVWEWGSLSLGVRRNSLSFFSTDWMGPMMGIYRDIPIISPFPLYCGEYPFQLSPFHNSFNFTVRYTVYP